MVEEEEGGGKSLPPENVQYERDGFFLPYQPYFLQT
jgi:hypothetical protein